MIDVKTLKRGDKVRIIDNQDNNINCFSFVKIGDIAYVEDIFTDEEVYVWLNCSSWKHGLSFLPKQLKLASEEYTQDVLIYKSRWDEIVNKLTSECSSIVGMTGKEVVAIHSVLRDNTPFCVVDDPIDPVISKKEQTHLDATHVGDTGNCALYYKSEILKKWFWWNDEYTWEKCCFKYEDTHEDLFPITISKSI